MTNFITITCGDLQIAGCSCVIVVPEKAVAEHGYITSFTAGLSGQGKHEFHALAQTAYYQYQDEELDIARIDAPVTVERNDQVETLTGGMLILRDGGGSIRALVHQGQRTRRLLEAAHRYATRWVRLDI